LNKLVHRSTTHQATKNKQLLDFFESQKLLMKLPYVSDSQSSSQQM